MKINMKKLAAWMLALLLVIQILPVSADNTYISDPAGGDPNTEFLAKLKIISEAGKSMFVEDDLQLSLPEGYDSATWTSENEEIAMVDENGLVHGVAPGTVKIKAQSGDQSSMIAINVLEREQQTEGDKPVITIIVNGDRVKAPYDGQAHPVTYTLSSAYSDFNPDLVSYSKELPSRTDGGITSGIILDKEAFSYGDENVEAKFEVNEGSIYITKAKATVTANDITIGLENIDLLELTATVEGVYGDDEIEYELFWPETKAANVYDIVPLGAAEQGNYEVAYVNGKLKIEDGLTINGTYLMGVKGSNNPSYTNVADALVSATPNGTKLKGVQYENAGNGLVILLGKPEAEPAYWTFKKLENGKYHISTGGQYLHLYNNKSAKLEGTPQELRVIKADGNGICISNDSDFRLNLQSWSYKNGFQASDWSKQKKLGIEANETIYLYRGIASGIVFNANGGQMEVPATVHAAPGSTITLPNAEGTKNDGAFIGWSTANNFYADKKDETYTYHELLLPGTSVTMPEGTTTYYAVYNEKGTDTKFGIRADGVMPREPGNYPNDTYSAHVVIENNLRIGHWIVDQDPNKPIVGNHIENNVTANLLRVPTDEEILTALTTDNKDKITYDPETQYIHWYVMKFATSWKIDGVIRNKPAEEKPEYSVKIVSSWPEGKTAYTGAEITLTAELTGFTGTPRIQWQHRSADGENWENIPGANKITYTYILNDETAEYVWRVEAEDVK
jgi:hypothetical protein